MSGAGIVLLLLLATLGGGGASPGVLLAWHGLLVALVLIAALGPAPPSGNARGLAPGIKAALALFVGWVWTGAFLAPFGYAAWLLLLELAAFVALACLAARRGTRGLRALIGPLWIGALLQCLWVMWQAWRVGQTRPAGTFLNPNHLAGWLVALLLLGTGEWLERGKPPRGTLARLALATPAIVALWLTASRGALLGLAAGGACLAVISWKELPRRWRLGLVGGSVLGLVLIVGVQLRRLDEPDPFRYQRVRIWSESMRTVVERPWTGVGPRQFGPASRNLQFPDENGPLRFDRTFSFPHSDLVRLPAELGWPGLVAALVVLGVTGSRLRRMHEAGKLRGPAAGATAALAALLAQGLVDHPSHRPALYLLGAGLWGALMSVPVASATRARKSHRVGLCLVLLAVFALGDVAPFLSWRATRDLPRGRLDGAQRSRLDRALRWNPVHPDPWLRRAEDLSSKPDWTAADYAVAREAAERAIRLQPADARYAVGLARVERRACRSLFGDLATRQRASEAYERGAGLSRFDPRIPTELAGFLLDTGDAEGARAAAERALALEPESVLPRLILADAWLASTETEGPRRARQLLAEAREKSRRWAHWAERSGYARAFLTLDPRDLERVRKRMAESTDPQDSTIGGNDPYIDPGEGDVEG